MYCADFPVVFQAQTKPTLHDFFCSTPDSECSPFFMMCYVLPVDRGQQKRLRFRHQRPPPSGHHPLRQADPGHRTVDGGLHESGAVRLSVGG